MPGMAEMVLILFTGGKPEISDLQKIVGEVEQASGIALNGTRVKTFGFPTAPDKDLALAAVANLEGENTLSPGALRRSITYDATVRGARWVVVVVRAKEEAGGGAAPAKERAGGGRARADEGARGGDGSRKRRERNSWVRELIPRHLAKLDDAGSGLAWKPGWATLGGEHALSFAASAKDGELMGFADVRILVSLFRETEAARIQKRMRGGYQKYLSKVADDAGVRFGDGQPDLAHWILCSDRKGHVVHLGYFPADLSQALFPWDLIPPDEQKETPRLG